MRTGKALLVGLVATSLFGLLPAARVSAHAEMTKSSPKNGVALTAAPAAVQAWFSEELASSGNHLRLYDAQNKLLAEGGLDPKVPGHRALILRPPHLRAGGYLVRWVAVAADDNAVTQGYFRFSIGTAAAAPSGMAQSSGMGSMGSMDSSGALPTLQLIGPADHSTVKNPVAVVIQSSGDVRKLTMSTQMSSPTAMAGNKVHLHIMVDGVTTMPGGDQLTDAGAHKYQYVLAPLSPGVHTVKVFWADNRTHEAVGPVHAATFTVTQ